MHARPQLLQADHDRQRLERPQGIATDGIKVYWISSTGSILRCGTNSNCATATIVPAPTSTSTLAVDETSLYHANSLTGTVVKITPK